LNKRAGSRAAAIISLIVTVLFTSVMAVPLVAGADPKGGHSDPQKTHGYDPDPEPSPSRSASRGGDCYGNPNHGGGGSNGGGAYDSHCDQGAGDNGNGGNGKCAGCTGKSDYKNPPGQHPGDHNNGYECDHNKGVGKGNPAHSQCRPNPAPSTPTTPTPSPSPSSSTPCIGSTCSPSTPPCVGGNCGPGPSPTTSESPCTGPNCTPSFSPSPTVSGNIIERCDADETMPGIQACTNPPNICDANTSMPGTQVCGNRIEGRQSTRTLPFTGAGAALLGYFMLGLALLVVGWQLAGNRKKTPS
jgi:hypothetical protein